MLWQMHSQERMNIEAFLCAISIIQTNWIIGLSNVTKTMHARSQKVVEVKNETNQGGA